jgi:hypothetical protein
MWIHQATIQQAVVSDTSTTEALLLGQLKQPLCLL